MPKKNTIQDSILQFLATSETGEGYSVKEIAVATGRDMAYTRTSLNAMCHERVLKKQIKKKNNITPDCLDNTFSTKNKIQYKTSIITNRRFLFFIASRKFINKNPKKIINPINPVLIITSKY